MNNNRPLVAECCVYLMDIDRRSALLVHLLCVGVEYHSYCLEYVKIG